MYLMRNAISYIVLSIVGIACIVGIAIASLHDQKPATLTPQQAPVALSGTVLAARLVVEQESIHAALTTAFPTLPALYSFEHEELFEQGQWYGAILTYKGTDADNRDSLRVIMQKKNETWIIRTTPPSILLSRTKLPDVPQHILDTINTPAPLPASGSSPAIMPDR